MILSMIIIQAEIHGTGNRSEVVFDSIEEIVIVYVRIQKQA